LAAERALDRGQAGTLPVLLIDGVVAGVWQQKRQGRRLAVTVEPLEPLNARRLRDLDDQVARLGEITGLRPEMVVDTVTVGKHA
jgi:hypothetical protein